MVVWASASWSTATQLEKDRIQNVYFWDIVTNRLKNLFLWAFYRCTRSIIKPIKNFAPSRVTQIKTYSWDNAQVILVGNKCDMEDERVISFERGKQLAEQLGVEFFETSAKENINVKVGFQSREFAALTGSISGCFRATRRHHLRQNVWQFRYRPHPDERGRERATSHGCAPRASSR